MVAAKDLVGYVFLLAGAALELSTAQNTIFHHVFRSRSKEIRTRLAMGLLDDVFGSPSRIHAIQVCTYLYRLL